MDDQSAAAFPQLQPQFSGGLPPIGEVLSPLGGGGPLSPPGGGPGAQACMLGNLPPGQLQLLLAMLQQQPPPQAPLSRPGSVEPAAAAAAAAAGLPVTAAPGLPPGDPRMANGGATTTSSNGSLNSSMGSFGSFTSSFATGGGPPGALSPNGAFGSLLQQTQPPLLGAGPGGAPALHPALQHLAPQLGPPGPGGEPQLPPGYQLPPEARDTIYIEDLPADVTKRELTQIFRHFPGYETVRLHVKDSVKHPGEKVNLAFVHFSNAYHATVALNALQHYRLDLEKGDQSPMLRLKYAMRHSRRHNAPTTTAGNL